ncbi:DegT/DnrJ/EryC1/StrS aminotransferase family protein [Rhodobacteraceae bacterium NNCM2]|nr:DegT/DnrJ/EryC1/StrS aminotransferase family protein [Coraliihabitans acroporae]
MLNTPFPPWPSFTDEEAEAVRRVLLSNRVNYWTGGEGRAFEAEFARFAGTEHAIAVANGTLALDLALHGLGIRPGDEVIVTPRSFVASASCIANAGAVPVFADVDADSQNITPETVDPLISARTRAILCVHLNGWPCDMAGLRDLTAGRGIALIEDCAQAHGARLGDGPVGGLGDVAAWSFCQDKIMTTGGEGGMVTTSDPDLWKRMWAFKDHGKDWDEVHRPDHPPGFRWLHRTLGTNFRLTEMQSAIGRIQLGRMPAWHAARTRNAAAIMAAARPLPAFRVPEIPAGVEHGFYKLYLFLSDAAERAGLDRDEMIARINAAGVPCMQGICPEIYREGAFAPQPPLPVAAQLGRTAMMFLVHPTLGEAEIARTCEVLAEVGQL